LLSVLIAAAGGCANNWHDKQGVQAEDIFDDPLVIALCYAIDDDDVEEIDRLVAEGADVNARGKFNVTPLFWAFPDNKPRRFLRLLEHGADPNVILSTSIVFGSPAASNFAPEGTSVTHLAAKSRYSYHFEYVFSHGGDANLVDQIPARKRTPLFGVLESGGSNPSDRIDRLIELGADIDHVDISGRSPAHAAVVKGRYDLALQLLEAGADFRLQLKNSGRQLIHALLSNEKNLENASPRKRADYERLLAWLVDHGVSIEQAREYLEIRSRR
jgi:ankyrin repeat protein